MCDAIERFGEDVLNPAGQWLKAPMAGGDRLVPPKMAILMGEHDTLKYEVSRMGIPLGVNSRVLEWVCGSILEL